MLCICEPPLLLQSQLCGMDQSKSSKDMVGRRKLSKEQNFDRSALSFHLIVDQWHFSVLKAFSLLSHLRNVSLNPVVFPHIVF